MLNEGKAIIIWSFGLSKNGLFSTAFSNFGNEFWQQKLLYTNQRSGADVLAKNSCYRNYNLCSICLVLEQSNWLLDGHRKSPNSLRQLRYWIFEANWLKFLSFFCQYVNFNEQSHSFAQPNGIKALWNLIISIN